MISGKIIMAGNPNVGKSTLFNRFTGLRQHTGNWPGKTVGSACGYVELDGRKILLTDTPGTYSLNASSPDEENARDTILFSPSDSIIVVCDACCPERSLFLALQIMELKSSVIVCLNLMDEAESKGISIDIPLMERLLGCPVLGVSASSGMNTDTLLHTAIKHRGNGIAACHLKCRICECLQPLIAYIDGYAPPLPATWLAVQVVDGGESIIKSLNKNMGLDVNDSELSEYISEAKRRLSDSGIEPESLNEQIDLDTRARAAEICEKTVKRDDAKLTTAKADKLLSKPLFAWASIVSMLFLILWLSIFAAEAPGAILFSVLSEIGEALRMGLSWLHISPGLISLLIDGVFSTVVWVVSVMLPPMLVFFPLFSILEEWGFLPRIAFNMDAYFKKCGACGKQALTMCMGLGCNTVGICGCRIIDSPRDKLIAVLTNSFMPCNGRFPILITLSSFIFAGLASPWKSICSAAAVTLIIILGALATFAASVLLYKTLFKGETSGFILEIPPYRKPKFAQVIVRAILDRTIFVLFRAIKAAAPAGLVIWLLANFQTNGESLLSILSAALTPIASPFGLDGAILLAFILGLPASEIVLPLMLMCYLSTGTLASVGDSEMVKILTENGWDWVRAACMMIFTVLHWPCISSLAAIKDECGKAKYIFLGILLPTTFGLGICAIINFVCKLI